MASIARADDVNVTVDLGDGRLVQLYQIVGCDYVVARAWEPYAFGTADAPHGTHSTAASFGGRRYGDVATRSLPASIERMPLREAGGTRYCQVRLAAVLDHHDANVHAAHAAIVEALPAAAEMGLLPETRGEWTGSIADARLLIETAAAAPAA